MEVVALDFETEDNRGGSIDYYRKDFRVTSIALSWRSQGQITNYYTDVPSKIRECVKRLSDKQVKVIAHNIGFDKGVAEAMFPESPLNWHACTLRLTQLYDAGGVMWEIGKDDDLLDDENPYQIGLGLKAAASRILPDLPDHKGIAYRYLEENHGITKNHGQYLGLLGPDEARAYNVGDTDATLLLYETLTEWFTKSGFDWQRDFVFYKRRTEVLGKLFREGLPVDRVALFQVIKDLYSKLQCVGERFREWGGDSLIRFERDILTPDYLSKWKTEKSREKQLADIGGRVIMNVGSTKQLKQFFVDWLGIEPPKRTEKGNPSFGSKYLHLWGPGGEILKERGELRLKLNQAIALYYGSEYDGKIHPSNKAAGTITNRMASGSSYD